MINNYIIYYALDIISYIILVGIFGKIYNEKIRVNFKCVFLILVLSIINSLASIDGLLLIKTLLAALSFYSICHFIYHKSPKNSLVTTIIYLVITLVSEMVIMLLLSFTHSLNMKYITGKSVLKAIITVSSVTFSYVVVSIKGLNKIINKCSEFFINQNKYIKAFVTLFLFITISCMLYVVNYSNQNSFIMNSIFVSICIITIILIINAIHSNSKLILLNNVLSDNEDTYNKIIDNYKTFKHNIMHEFNCIKSVGNKKVNELIDAYVNETKSEEDYDLDLSKVPKSLKIIIYKCLIKHNFYDIDIKVNSFIKTDPIIILSSTKYCKMSQILGILLDNALEASKNIRDPFVYIILKEDSETYTIQIVNKFINDIKLINNETVSTKKDHMGMGIKYINSTKASTKFCIRNDKYFATVIINK